MSDCEERGWTMVKMTFIDLKFSKNKRKRITPLSQVQQVVEVFKKIVNFVSKLLPIPSPGCSSSL